MRGEVTVSGHIRAHAHMAARPVPGGSSPACAYTRRRGASPGSGAPTAAQTRRPRGPQRRTASPAVASVLSNGRVCGGLQRPRRSGRKLLEGERPRLLRAATGGGRPGPRPRRRRRACGALRHLDSKRQPASRHLASNALTHVEPDKVWVALHPRPVLVADVSAAGLGVYGGRVPAPVCRKGARHQGAQLRAVAAAVVAGAGVWVRGAGVGRRPRRRRGAPGAPGGAGRGAEACERPCAGAAAAPASGGRSRCSRLAQFLLKPRAHCTHSHKVMRYRRQPAVCTC